MQSQGQIGSAGTSLVAQLLRLHAPNAETQVRSLIRELRPRLPHGADKKKGMQEAQLISGL